MKIAHAQLHMYTNIMNKFQSSTCQTVGEKLWTNCVHGQTDAWTDFVVGDISTKKIHKFTSDKPIQTDRTLPLFGRGDRG